MKDYIARWGRVFLGLFLIVYGLNQFFHFLPSGYGRMPDEARNFIDAVYMYLPFLYMFEILIGFLLVFNRWTAFILIVLFPLSVSFLIFTYANQDLSESWPALLVAALNVYLVFHHRERYKPLFER